MSEFVILEFQGPCGKKYDTCALLPKTDRNGTDMIKLVLDNRDGLSTISDFFDAYYYYYHDSDYDDDEYNNDNNDKMQTDMFEQNARFFYENPLFDDKGNLCKTERIYLARDMKAHHMIGFKYKIICIPY